MSSTGNVKITFVKHAFEDAKRFLKETEILSQKEKIKKTKYGSFSIIEINLDYETFCKFQNRVKKENIELCSPGLDRIVITVE